MGTFAASLKTMGDRRGLPATISVDDGHIRIDAGDAPIGSWLLTEIDLQPTPTGFRMAAEGEQLFIELSDTAGFQSEIAVKNKRNGGRRGGRAKSTRTKTIAPSERPAHELNGSRTGKRATERTFSFPAKDQILNLVDKSLALAKKRWGSLLPEWVFTRVMFAVVVGAFILMVIFPTWVSTFLLVAGLVLVVFGSVVYMDSIMASKWLPGRMAPMHVLLFGVATLLFGVLLGVIAN